MPENEITVSERWNDAGDRDGYRWRIGHETGVLDEAGYQRVKAAVRGAIADNADSVKLPPEVDAAVEAAIDEHLAERVEARDQALAALAHHYGQMDHAGVIGAANSVLRAFGYIGEDHEMTEPGVSDATKSAFLLAADAMNRFALLAHADPGVTPELATKINDLQQALSGCDWPIVGYDTSDPPAADFFPK